LDSISDEEKVDLIYDREVNWDAIVSHYEYTNQNFVDQIKELYLYLDEKGEIHRQAEDAYKKEQEALLKIQQELELEEIEAKQKIREELGMLEPETVSEPEILEEVEIVCGTGTVLIDHICQVDKIEEKEKEIPVEKTVDIPVEKPSKKSVNWFSSFFDWLGGLFK